MPADAPPTMSADRTGDIARAAAAAGLTLPSAAPAQLAAYLDLLARWNRVHNLTAVRDVAAMIPRHLLDSLAGAAHLHAGPVLDAGTGAGLPGLPLALARPDLGFTLVDVSLKRTQFLQHVVAQLGLAPRVEVRRADVATLPGGTHRTVVARALAPLDRLLAQLAHLCVPGARLLAWRSGLSDAERAVVAPPWRLLGVHAYDAPEGGARRVLVELDREGA